MNDPSGAELPQQQAHESLSDAETWCAAAGGKEWRVAPASAPLPATLVPAAHRSRSPHHHPGPAHIHTTCDSEHTLRSDGQDL